MATPDPENVERLKEGDHFATVEDAKVAVKHFGEAIYADFKVDTNNKYSLKFCCKHGGRKRIKKCKGERINQHYNNMGCKAVIMFYKSRKDGTLSCTSVDNNHNHDLSEAVYKHDNIELSKEELDLCANLSHANAKPSQIKRVLKEKFRKEVTIQKLKNLMRKIPAGDAHDEVDFNEFFTALEADGGQVDWLDDPDGSVRCMTFASSKMLKAFQSSDPPLIQLDTTFELEEARYKLMAAVYLNPTTNKSEVAFMALMSDETNISMEFALSRLKQICLRYTLIFIVDKDFGQLAVLNSIFPNSRILLCIFHAIKFMKNLIATAPVVVDKKKALLDQFKKVLYANTEDIFKKKDAKFLRVCGNVTIKSGEGQKSLADYYQRNWNSCQNMWVKCFRKSLPCLGDNTSNRVERYFWTVKKAFKDTFMALPKTVTAAVSLIKFADQRLMEKYMFSKNKVLVIYDENKEVLENNEKASQILNDRGCILFHASQKKLAENMNKYTAAADNTKVIEGFSRGLTRSYEASLTSCNCSFSSTHQAPCPHTLFLRKESGESIFSPELFHLRYHRTSSGLDEADEHPFEETLDNGDMEAVLEEENNNDRNDLVLDDRKKYAMVTPILLRIGNLISCHPTKKFLRYLDGLNELEKRVRRGQNFLLSIDKIVAEAEDDDENDDEADINIEVVDDPRHDIASDTGVGEEDVDINDSINDSQDTIVQSETSQEVLEDTVEASGSQKRKFDRMKFKMGLKNKGRPKKKSKQFSFNKGAADKKARRVTKNKKVVDDSESSENDVDDSESSENDDDDVELKLDDSSGDENIHSSPDEEITFHS